MRKVLLHFRLLFVLAAAFTYFIVRQFQHSVLCLVSYKKALQRFDKHLYRHARMFCKLAEFILGIRFAVPSAHEIKRALGMHLGKPAIILANHQSLMDIMMLIAAFPIPIRFVSKKVLGRFVPYISKVNRAYRNALIDRKAGIKTIGLVRDLARRCRKNLAPMVIFAEGTRTRTDDVKKFHNAAVRASLTDGPMNIIVVALDGGVFFPKLFSFPDTKNKRYMYMKILKVFENVTRGSAKEHVEEAEELIRAYIARWRKEHGVSLPITEHTQRRHALSR